MLQQNIYSIPNYFRAPYCQDMAKSLLLNVLVDVLGNYVEGLSRENLKVAVWSGTIDLSNLKLKGTALDNLNLPIKVVRGSLKTLHLKIPWASLESKPVVVELDGIYLQAGPLDIAKLSPEEAQRMISASKDAKLQDVERSILNMIKKKEDLQDTAKKATYVQQLTAKIIDNLEVSLTNLHIRYEDCTSIPSATFSCGVTIETLALTTTDESWSSRFVTRDLSKRKETAIHKLGTMENFSVYWNTSSTPLEGLKYSEWESHMHARIFRSSTGETIACTASVYRQLLE
jgi:vacuolar protein sorting-associated protein 13A/C